MGPLDNPWPLVALCAGIAVLFVGGFVSTKRRAHLAGALLAVAAAAAVVVAERLIVTDSERVTAAVHAVVEAFQRRDAAETLRHFSPTAANDRAAVQKALGLVEVGDDLRLFDVGIDFRPDGAAVSDFRANATVRVPSVGFENRTPTRWKLTWKQEAGEWKITRIERLDPVDGKNVDHFSR